MNKSVIVGLAMAAVVAVFFAFNYMSWRDEGVLMESSIEAQYEQNKNSLSAYSLTVVEQMGIADKYKTAVSDVIVQSMEGRFGDNGSQAMVQAFTEAYPGQLDPTMYTRIQNAVEAGRRDFAAEQKMLISKVQTYKNALNKTWSGMWLSTAGFPKLDLKKYDVIVSGHTQKTYQTGVDEGIKF